MGRSEVGLTLLEVVLSVAILSTVALSFVNLFGSGFGASMQAGRISQATVLAQEKMEVLHAHSYAELLQRGVELSGGIFPCPGNAVSSTPEDVSGFDGLQRYFSMQCDLLEFDGYMLEGISLEVVVQQGEGRALARFNSFIPKGR